MVKFLQTLKNHANLKIFKISFKNKNKSYKNIINQIEKIFLTFKTIK